MEIMGLILGPRKPNFSEITVPGRTEMAETEDDQRQRNRPRTLRKQHNQIGLGKSLVDAACMEQLLVHCAAALETNDVTLAQQLMWVLNNIASPDGDPNQRATSFFLRALVARAAKMGMKAPPPAPDQPALPPTKRLSAIELAGFVDLTPWHRFGFTAANGAILEAVDGYDAIHIVDMGMTHCMQWPTLIDALAKKSRLSTPPNLRLTVCGARPPVPPLIDMTYHDLGVRLANFARSRNVPFAFRAVGPPHLDARQFASLDTHFDPAWIDRRDGEALVVNCHFRLHYIPTDNPTLGLSDCPRDAVLRAIREAEPRVVTVVEEDADLSAGGLVSRLRSAFNYLWIPFDALDTFLARDSEQRSQYERDVGFRIENVIASEGRQRFERLESKAAWCHRMRSVRFRSVSFSAETIAQVKAMLDEHAAGWGLKSDGGDHLLLTWKGHNVVFASAWTAAKQQPEQLALNY